MLGKFREMAKRHPGQPGKKDTRPQLNFKPPRDVWRWARQHQSRTGAQTGMTGTASLVALRILDSEGREAAYTIADALHEGRVKWSEIERIADLQPIDRDSAIAHLVAELLEHVGEDSGEVSRTSA